MEKEVPDSEKKLVIRKRYLDKLSDILSRDVIEESEIYPVVRGFFSEFLKLEYEFTYEELSAELNKIYIKPSLKREIDTFLENLLQIEYAPENQLEHAQIKAILGQVKSFVESLISVSDTEEKKASLLDKLFRKKTAEVPLSQPAASDFTSNIKDIVKDTIEEEQEISEENKILKETMPEQGVRSQHTHAPSDQRSIATEDDDKDVQRIYALIEDAYIKMNNPKKAKESYDDALRIYKKLPAEKQKKIYVHVYELFIRLSSL